MAVKMYFLALGFVIHVARLLQGEIVDEPIKDAERGVCDSNGDSTGCKIADQNQGNSKYSSSGKQERGPPDPYSSYLDYPRLTFSGHFRADTPTLNNFVPNYNVDNLKWGDDSPQDNWNPWGSGEWGIDANVTSVCYVDGPCIAHKSGDPIIGSSVQDGGIKTAGKMAALDVQVETFACEIWGWTLRVGDQFSGSFKATGSQYLWRKVTNGTTEDPYRGSVYQSILTDVTWLPGSESSQFARKLRELLGDSGQLSIKFNLDIISEEPGAKLGVGRIVGSIGVSGAHAPPFASKARLLSAHVDYAQDAPFKFDKGKQRLVIDFGNSLPIKRNGSYAVEQIGLLMVALPALGKSAKEACISNDLLYMGGVAYTEGNWYQATAGIQAFDLLPPTITKELTSRPMMVVKVAGEAPFFSCTEVVLAEDSSGLAVYPLTNWLRRVEPTELATFKLMVTRYGEFSSGSEIELHECTCPYVFPHGLKVGEPKLYVPSTLRTEPNGNAALDIRTVDPGNIRDKYIDGQLYGYLYCIPGTCPNQDALCTEKNRFKLMKHLITFRVFSLYIPKGEATWYKDVQPIFQQYAALFPVMKNFMDLGDYDSVVHNKEDVKNTLLLSMDEPNHMPVNRDLSKSKRDMIVKWLSDDPPKQGSMDYTLENLKKMLQTAIELEHSTIPPYLTALASIKPGYNRKVYDILKSVVVQEMLHLSLAANVLNAVGGAPTLYFKNFIPRYPTEMPGGAQPNLVIPIEKCSMALISNVFMGIERPAVTVDMKVHPLSFSNISQCSDEVVRYCEEYNTFKSTRRMGMAHTSGQEDCTGELPYIPPIVIHNNTIGGFYNHIMCYLVVLSCPQGQGLKIFTGNESRQIEHDGYFGNGKYGHGQLFKVTNLATALEAIREIVEEGEGSSPCNPISWVQGNASDLSHYFLFDSIVEGSLVEVCNVTNPDSAPLNDAECSETTFNFTGPKIRFDTDGVWPMIPNPRMSHFAPGSKAQAEAIQFNRVYTKLLLALNETFNGHPEKLGDAISVMHSLIMHLNQLVRVPLHDDGDPYVGPNAGPTYDFDP